MFRESQNASELFSEPLVNLTVNSVTSSPGLDRLFS